MSMFNYKGARVMRIEIEDQAASVHDYIQRELGRGRVTLYTQGEDCHKTG